jgi:hypothetical protein
MQPSEQFDRDILLEPNQRTIIALLRGQAIWMHQVLNHTAIQHILRIC